MLQETFFKIYCSHKLLSLLTGANLCAFLRLLPYGMQFPSTKFKTVERAILTETEGILLQL